MSTAESQKLLIDKRAYSYAKIYSSLLSDEYQRKRSYASIVALYAFLNLVEKTPYNIQKSMTLFRNPNVNEQYEITDLYINNWHLDIRVLTGGDAVLVPRIHYDCDIVPDYYVVIKVDSSLENAELLGFADASKTDSEAFDYNYRSVPLSSLISYDDFLDKIKNEKTENFTEDDHKLFTEAYLNFMDNDIGNETKNLLLKHLFECSECRTEFCCFTGFEMVSCNASKYPELMNDQTLGIVGAQNVDDKKYEGKEETIYIENDTNTEEIEDIFNTIPPQTETEKIKEEIPAVSEEAKEEKVEETVEDILDELFGDEDFIENSSHEDKPIETPIPVQNFVDSEKFDILDDNDFIPENNIAAENNDLEIIDNENTTELNNKIDFDGENIIHNKEEYVSDYDNDDLVILEKNQEIEFIDEKTEQTELSDDIDITLDSSTEIDTSVQKVIVDYDETGEPVYSYITSIDDDSSLTEEKTESIDNSEKIEEYIEPTANDFDNYEETAPTYEYNDEINNKNISSLQENYQEKEEELNSENFQPDSSDYITDDDILEKDTNTEKDEETSAIDENNFTDENYEEYQEEDNENTENGEEQEYAEYEEDGDNNYLNRKNKNKSSNKIAAVILSTLVLLGLIGGVGGFLWFKNSQNSQNVANNTNSNTQNAPVTNDMFDQPAMGDIELINGDGETDVQQDNNSFDTGYQTSQQNEPLTEENLLPPQQEETRSSDGNINKAIVNSFMKQSSGVSLRELNWLCSSELFTDKEFRTYLQNLDNILKQNLRNNFMNSTEKPQNESVSAKFAVDNNGNLQKVIISESSGSQEIDNIVLQSINETFDGEKSQILNESTLKSDTYYLKVVIKI